MGFIQKVLPLEYWTAREYTSRPDFFVGPDGAVVSSVKVFSRRCLCGVMNGFDKLEDVSLVYNYPDGVNGNISYNFLAKVLLPWWHSTFSKWVLCSVFRDCMHHFRSW